MQTVLTIITAAAFAALAAACGAGSGTPGAASTNTIRSPLEPAPLPTPTEAPAVDLSGTWTGTGVDSNTNTGANATTVVTLTLTQSGANVSGTMKTQSLDPMGTTCHSCHRSRTGTLSGIVSGTTLTWNLLFPTDPANDPTPVCGAMLEGTAKDMTASSVSGIYAGEDACEGLIQSGTVTMAPAPQPGP